MQIALDPPALGVDRAGEACAAGLQLGQTGAQLCLQPRILEQ
jgi:hypothetical protein